jgi:spoIIIJ-associated protein
MDDSINYAKKYVEDMLSFFGLNTDVRATYEEDVIELSVPSTYLNGFLIGQRGDTLRSLQFLTSSALKNQGHEFYRVNLDIADYKKHRQDRLAREVEKWVSDMRDKKQGRHLKPMNAADRRIVHKVIGEYSDLTTSSEGVGRDRHVVVTYEELKDDTEE